jgi:electron transfer flavoprotein alpha/beta subunit
MFPPKPTQVFTDIIDRVLPQAPETTRTEITREIVREHEKILRYETQSVERRLPRVVTVTHRTLNDNNYQRVAQAMNNFNIRSWTIHNYSTQAIFVRFTENAAYDIPIQPNGSMTRDTVIDEVWAQRTNPGTEPLVVVEIWLGEEGGGE